VLACFPISELENAVLAQAIQSRKNQQGRMEKGNWESQLDKAVGQANWKGQRSSHCQVAKAPGWEAFPKPVFSKFSKKRPVKIPDFNNVRWTRLTSDVGTNPPGVFSMG